MAKPFEFADDGRKPWEQQPGESDTQYQRFRYYLDHKSTPRRLAEIAQELVKRDKRKITAASIITYAGRWRWRDRAALRDAEVHKHTDEKLLTTAERIQTAHLEAATILRERVIEEVAARPLGEASLRDLTNLLGLAYKIERETLGLDRKQLEVTGPDGQPLVVSLDGLDPDARAASLAETTRELQNRLDRLHRAQAADAD